MQDIIAFTTVRGPGGWMGNMAPHPIRYAGKTWRTSEALFQALRFDDEAIQEQIRQQKSPMAAKFVAKRLKRQMKVVPQSDLDLAQMEHVLWLKLEQHPELKEKMLETGTAEIIEDSTSRPRGSGLFWGAALREDRWVGENHLGKLWMKLRKELREARSRDFGSHRPAPGRLAEVA